MSKVLNIGLLTLSMLTIFLFSCETASESTNTSKSVAKDVVSVVVGQDVRNNPNLNAKIDDHINVVRKIAHILEFALLGFFIINVLKDYYQVTYKIVLISILLAILYAISDEIHQLFVDGRGCQIIDIVIDTVGSSLGIITYYLLYSKFKKKNI